MKETESVVQLQNLKKSFAARPFCSPCCHKAAKLPILAQHKERHRAGTCACWWGCGTAAAVPALPLENSLRKLCPNTPAFTSALQLAHCKASSVECFQGTNSQIPANPCRDARINSLLLDGFWWPYTTMPNSIWTKPWDRELTLFPVFIADKTFLKVFVKYFSKWIKNPPLLSVAAWSSHLMHKIIVILPGNLLY